MMKLLKKLRPIISPLLLVATIIAAAVYLHDHSDLITQLKKTPLYITVMVFLLYCIMFLVLMAIFTASLNLASGKINWKDNFKLNSHSMLINFFVPGQGGVAYRGVYMQKRHGFKLKNYLLVTIIYFVFYTLINVFLLFTNLHKWWLSILASCAALVLILIVLRWYASRKHLSQSDLKLNPKFYLLLFTVTLIQALIQGLIFYIELSTTHQHYSITQVMSYTGMANLTIFVALTPGAIGIRESFLIFSQNIHHVSSSSIIVANVIDRSVFIVFLLCVLAVTVVTHMKGRLDIKRLPELIKQTFKSDLS